MPTRQETIDRINEKANLMRRHAVALALKAAGRGDGAHIGPGLSCAEITATLYFGGILRYDAKDPTRQDRDRFVMSKGHGVLGYYTALAEAGFFSPQTLLDLYDADEGPFPGHPYRNPDLGIEASTGSLGHGLSIAVGLALTARLDARPFDTYVLLGDGECNEGMVWEAVMMAYQYRLDNLVAIVDRNRLQSDGLSREIIDMDPLDDKWKSFGWMVREVDGHDAGELLLALHRKSRPKGRPYVVIAHTIKGKGVSFFEDNNAWHHNKITPEQAEEALLELGEH